jgi:hypothetical protein
MICCVMICCALSITTVPRLEAEGHTIVLRYVLRCSCFLDVFWCWEPGVAAEVLALSHKFQLSQGNGYAAHRARPATVAHAPRQEQQTVQYVHSTACRSPSCGAVAVTI